MAAHIYKELTCVYNPVFNRPDADVVLVSSEGTSYRVPSFTLRNTSGMFRKLLSQAMQMTQNVVTREEAPILIPEPDQILERVLRMMSGLEIPRWESFDQLEDVLVLVEKWDAQGPLSTIRSAITAPLFLSEPLRLYAIATGFGWDDEARLASKHTLALCLYDAQHQPTLQRLSAQSLLALFAFHRQRRDEFKRFLDTDEAFSAGNGDHFPCPSCGDETDDHTWRELKARIFLEMDRRPLGDTLSGLDMEEWPEAIACWDMACKKMSCGKYTYNKAATLRAIKDGIDRLPTTI